MEYSKSDFSKKYQYIKNEFSKKYQYSENKFSKKLYEFNKNHQYRVQEEQNQQEISIE
jgi:hypothetical protein